MYKKTVMLLLVFTIIGFVGADIYSNRGILDNFVRIFDSNGNEIKVEENGGLAIAIQDQSTEMVDLKMSKKIADINITRNTTINSLFVNISSSIAPQVDDLACFKEGKNFYQGNILSVTSLGGTNYQIKLDRPLDYAYTTNGGCSIRDDNWAVDGSVTSQTFSVSPSGLNNVTWDITRIMYACLGTGVGVSNTKPDLSSFFTMTSLTNGIVFRTVNGVTKNIFSAKDNFHLSLEAYDILFYDKAVNGLYAVSGRRSFNGLDKNGVVIRLNSETNDRFDFIVQDDLTDMSECHIVVHGHVTSD